MKNFVIYETSGKIIRTGYCQDIDFELQVGESENITEGTADATTQYIDNGVVTDMPERPVGYYKFDYTQKAWVQDYDKADAEQRIKRSRLLKESDWTQLPDVPLTNKTGWANYRQQLRDIPEQSGYPYNINWPMPPQ